MSANTDGCNWSRKTAGFFSRGLRLSVWLLATFAGGSALATPPALPPGRAGELIERFHMTLVPDEEVWFSVSYGSEDQLDGKALPTRYKDRAHSAGSGILVVATARDFSALHRLQTDEVWHFYGGAPLDLLLLYPDGHGERVTLGSDVLHGQFAQFTVPRGVWQGAAPRGHSPQTYSFVGTTMSPAFDPADFEIGYRDELVRKYPAFSRQIAALTRSEFAVRPAAAASSSATMTEVASAFPPGVQLTELVGRSAPGLRTSALSVAKFVLEPGHGTGTSYNHESQEVFMVTAGRGVVHVADRVLSVAADSTVLIPAGARHSIAAASDSVLTFYAISAPAFAPDDYVLVSP